MVEIRERLAQLLRETPDDAEAIEHDARWWQWGRLKQIASAVTAALDGAGLGRHSRVGLILQNRPEHVAALAGLLAGGRVVVTLSPLQPPVRLAADIEQARLALVIGSPETLSREGVLDAVTSRGIALEVDDEGEVRERGGTVPHDAETCPGVAIEMLTSGTTGPPKRVRLSDRQLDGSLVSSGQVPREGRLLSRSVTVAVAPMVHIGGMWRVLGALCAGRRIVLMSKFVLEPWVSAVERYRPRAAGLVPAALRSVLDAGVPPERLKSLQVITSGTTACPPELADRFFHTYGARVLMTYGATEFAGAVAGWTYEMHKAWWATKAGSAGRPFGDTVLRVTDTDGAELRVGEVGHLEVRTSQSVQGAGEWVQTSDLARIDADGFLWITGRADDAIIRGGFKVQPSVVARILEAHPAVREAGVAGLPDGRLGAVPVAAVELEPGTTVGEAALVADLIERCRAELTPYEVPAYVIVVEALPRTPSSKVSKMDLLDLVRARMAEPAPA
ncbi:fatty acid--CoA ligase family protein [Nonomuraea sp. NPDC005650]|uniref:class I adenylate-forming enzyme family protein n=1 Tax=Nonomuraea sp. NPDC005650 TaxID=3157045 RepID=UPI0033A6B27B